MRLQRFFVFCLAAAVFCSMAPAGYSGDPSGETSTGTEEAHSLGSGQYSIETLPAPGAAQAQMSTMDEALSLEAAAVTFEQISDSEETDVSPEIVKARRSLWQRAVQKLRNAKHRTGNFVRSRFGKNKKIEDIDADTQPGSAQFSIEQMPPAPGLPQIQPMPPMPRRPLPTPETSPMSGAVTATMGLEPAPRPPVPAETSTPEPLSSHKEITGNVES